MKKVSVITFLILLFPALSFAFCSKPDCVCFTKKCEAQRELLRKNEATVDGSEITNQQSLRSCYYIVPLNDEERYIYKVMSTSGCQKLFQVGYLNIADLKGTILKSEFDEELPVSYRTSFDSLEAMMEFLLKAWPEVEDSWQKSIAELK